MLVMTQSLKGGDGPHLLHGLSVVNMYTKVISEGKQVAGVVRSMMTTPVTIAKGTKVTHVVTVNVVPPAEVTPSTLEKLDEIQGIQQTKMTVE